ncbi:MAG: DUF4340 domain-containing protein [Ignavibacteria bacterium]|nr:DUF4340 domain-containing protein [Ignavibacteria bacterium]
MSKQIKILLAVFAVLIAVYFLFFRTGERVSTEKIDAKLFVADSSKIDKIEIVKNNETIVLEKQGDKWKISKPIDYPADTNAVYPMLKDLKNFIIESVASENPSKFSNFIDSANNTQVSTYQEGKLLGTFILGKAQGFQNAYVKRPEENRVLLASNISPFNFNKQLKDFRNKHVVSIVPITVSRVDFKSTDSNNVNFSAIKDSLGVWRIDGDSVATSLMDGYLNTFSNLNAEDFKDTVMTEFPVPTYTLTIYSPAGQTVINLYHEKGSSPNSFICQVSGVNQLFRFFDGMAGQIMKKKKDFITEKKK